MEGRHSDAAQPTANYSLLTANSTIAPPVSPVPLIQHSTLSIQHWSYTFSAKERDSETGLSYFGSRYYSSDLSIWLSVDPMSDKYPSLSPYSYCANNPVKLVDPNGEDIEIITETDANGKKTITINFTAKIINKSSHAYSDKEMKRLRDNISSGIKDIYSGQYGDAAVTVNVDIICNVDEKTNDVMKESNRHSINIVDRCSNANHVAEAEDFGNKMDIKWDIGQGANDNDIKRTAAHEFGHLLGLPDVDIKGNLMQSGGIGTTVTLDQINEAVGNHKTIKTNQGIWYRNFERDVHNHCRK
jgi:RHS repeat-associated protein